MKKESLIAARAAYEIEYECIKNMLEYFDDEAFGKAVELFKVICDDLIDFLLFHAFLRYRLPI